MLACMALMRPRVALAAACASVGGAWLHGPAYTPSHAGLFLGCFLLAGAACALNQAQERRTDALMLRTRSRPIPAGQLSPARALGFAVCSGAAGLILLGYASWKAALLGGLAVVFYNLLYTPLKPRSAHAPLVGSVAGAMPPVIGWAYAGGGLLDPMAVGLFVFFYLWQTPHVMMVLALNEADYRRAGFPVLSGGSGGRARVIRIAVVWGCASIAAALMIAARAASAVALVPLGLVLAGAFLGLAYRLRSSSVA